ncbi:hypothetical protein [Streptosporangium roseum]|uniref:Uncharacterized protein n=1 Tax=Streptosporangium roseum (strain ATCC 12428 / DSM 43021 / JCM 3005 / KCTC 9067 / NCIMB 10171 / NRRL 2505 / NI 9100) TaxID=479432 RepID=D2B634_STRRD|nr:hypothetical protein [Streptosporangium roseum]ACZ83747.1 hypothetical protein Sros_0728 [Streptosporangium roseum DSM 43021]
MDALKTMWEAVPPATPEELAGARRRLLDGMHPRRRYVTAPRMLVAAGVAAAAAVTPLIIGNDIPAYAVAKGSGGTLTVTLNELRDPDGLQAKLGAAGVKADVTFLAAGTRCAGPRFAGVDSTYNGPGTTGPDELRSLVNESRSFKAAQATSVRTIRISPEHIKPGETLVLEFRDNANAQVPWQLGSWLARADTPVQPCTPVEDTN